MPEVLNWKSKDHSNSEKRDHGLELLDLGNVKGALGKMKDSELLIFAGKIDAKTVIELNRLMEALAKVKDQRAEVEENEKSEQQKAA